MDIESLKQSFETDLAAAGNEPSLRAVHDKDLSRKNGLISAFMKAVASAPVDKRPRLGKAATDLKQPVETLSRTRPEEAALARPAVEAIDVTLPGRAPLLGHRHPLTLLRERLESIFLRFGFLIVEGPEL